MRCWMIPGMLWLLGSLHRDEAGANVCCGRWPRCGCMVWMWIGPVCFGGLACSGWIADLCVSTGAVLVGGVAEEGGCWFGGAARGSSVVGRGGEWPMASGGPSRVASRCNQRRGWRITR